MGEEANQLLEQAMTLPEGERRELALRLLRSLGTAEDQDIMEAWYDEAERRLADVREGRAQTVPWEQVRDKLLSSL